MNSRQLKLLQRLITKQATPLIVKQIATDMNCSEKTIRNDLQAIETYLRPWSTAALVRKPGVGVYLEIGETERPRLYKQISQVNHVSLEERLLEIAHHLLVSKQPITLQSFANTYFVDRSVIKRDFEALEKWLHTFDLTLVSIRGTGNIIEGNELSKRNAIAHLSQLISPQAEKNSILHLFLPHEISTVKQALQKMQQSYQLAFIDEAFESLLIHALIMIKRTRQNTNVFVEETEIKNISEKPEFQETLSFLATLEAKLAIRFPIEEKTYFTWHVISAKRSHTNHTASEELENVMNELTTKLREFTMVAFGEDAILMEGLELHMQAVLNRLTYGFPITNPLLADIKKMYPYMFGMVLLATEELTTLNTQLPEDEIAYLTLHFQASVERQQQQNNQKKRGIIVCHLGVGTSHLLQAKLEQQFKEIDIIACIGEAELQPYLASAQADFIISTTPIQETSIPSILISPLLHQHEQERVAEFLQSQQQASYTQVESPISVLLPEESIFLSVQKTHRFEVVEMLADHLFEKGYVHESYPHSVMQREQVSATSIGSGIALPHGNPKAVFQPVIAAAVLEEPLSWGDEWVSVVFLLATMNEEQKQTKGVFQQLATLCDQPEKITALQTAGTTSNFLEKLNSK